MDIHEVKLGSRGARDRKPQHKTGHRSDSTPPLPEGTWALWRPLKTDTGEASRTDQGTPETWRRRELRRPWLGALETIACGLHGLILRPGLYDRILLAPQKNNLGRNWG